MSSFSESGRIFRFDKQWEVLKYDDHHYYQIVSGRSFSGVDFAGLLNDEELVLIEIKNFYQYDNQGAIEDLNQFALEIKEKLLDTIDLIHIIYKYHQRSWMYRRFNRVVMRFPWVHYTWWFWTRMKELIEQEAFAFVLLIESVEKRSLLLKEIKKTLKEESYSIPNIKIMSLETDQIPGLQIVTQDKEA